MTKAVWELAVIGDEEKFDTNDKIELAVNQTLAEYLAEAQEVQLLSHLSDYHDMRHYLHQVRTAVSRVRLRLSKMRQHQWWLQTKVYKHIKHILIEI